MNRVLLICTVKRHHGHIEEKKTIGEQIQCTECFAKD